MSRNLRLVSSLEAFRLFQTPTRITDEALKYYDKGERGTRAATHALSTYKKFLLEEIQLDREEVEVLIKRIEAYMALVPNAKFAGW